MRLAAGFEWIGTSPALVAFAVATVLEVCAFYVPWLDHALDVIAAPAAVVAGILATASVVTDVSPFAKWSLAVIAGGGIAGTLQSGSIVARAASGAMTGGLGNFAVATVELVGAAATSALALRDAWGEIVEMTPERPEQGLAAATESAQVLGMVLLVRIAMYGWIVWRVRRPDVRALLSAAS